MNKDHEDRVDELVAALDAWRFANQQPAGTTQYQVDCENRLRAAIDAFVREGVGLRRRLEVLERHAVLSMISAGSSWSSEWGADFSRCPNSNIVSMVMGRIPWDPKKLTEGR